MCRELRELTSMIRSDPVMKVDASDARKTAVLFSSSTFPRRSMGVREHHIFFCASRAGTRFKAVSIFISKLSISSKF
jgi:hypothetical protein